MSRVNVDPFTFLAFGGDLPTQHAGEPVADGEAEAGSTVSRVAPPSTWRNSSKISPSAALGMPMPVSVTASSTRSPTARTWSVIEPSFCELGGVAQEVDEDLLELLLIGAERRRSGPRRSLISRTRSPLTRARQS